MYFNEQSEKGNSEEADAHLDKLLPELTRYCGYVRDYVANHMGKVTAREDGDEGEPDEVRHFSENCFNGVYIFLLHKTLSAL